MVAEAIDVLLVHLETRLHQLIILVVTHGESRVERTGHKQVDALCATHPLVVQTLLHAHADGQLTELHVPNADPRTFLRQRILATSRNDDHRIVHRRLQNVHQWHTAVHNLQRLTKLQRRGLTVVVEQSLDGRLRRQQVLNLHLHARLAIESLRLSHVVARKLRLRSPLGREYDGFRVLRLGRLAKHKESRYHQNQNSFHFFVV